MTHREILEALEAKDWPKINAWMAVWRGWTPSIHGRLEYIPNVGGLPWAHKDSGERVSSDEYQRRTQWQDEDGGLHPYPPQSCTSHDAVYLAEERLAGMQRVRYIYHLVQLKPWGRKSRFALVHAEAHIKTAAILMAVLDYPE